MRVTGVSECQIKSIVETVSVRHYNGNVVVRESRDLPNSKGNRSTFTMRTLDSRGPGSKRSWQGRRGIGACWHVHYYVLEELFNRYPDAKVVTMLATYTVNDWKHKAEETRSQNVGSAFQPAYPDELCECGW